MMPQVFDEGVRELQASSNDGETTQLLRFDVHRECGALTVREFPEKLIPRVRSCFGALWALLVEIICVTTSGADGRRWRAL
jgi:hypothetical protein